jgi:ribonuclease HI
MTESPDYVLFAPVVTENWHHCWLGARERTNNTAELSAIGELMLWLLQEAPDLGDTAVHVRFDSTYAANVAQGLWEPRVHFELAARVRELRTEVSSRRVVTWEHVKAHRGTHDNELADRAAAVGAEGRVSAASRRWTAPPPISALARARRGGGETPGGMSGLSSAVRDPGRSAFPPGRLPGHRRAST